MDQFSLKAAAREGAAVEGSEEDCVAFREGEERLSRRGDRVGGCLHPSFVKGRHRQIE